MVQITWQQQSSFLSVLWKWMQCRYGIVGSSDSATGRYFYPTARFTKRCCLLCLPLLKFSPSLPPFSCIRWSSRWRKQKPSDGRSWRERDRSPTSSTSTPVSPHAAALTHAPVCTGHLLIFLPAGIDVGSRACLLCAKARVGSGAPLEPFISLTVKVGKKNEGYDSKIWLSTLAHMLLLLTQLITYVSVCVCLNVRYHPFHATSSAPWICFCSCPLAARSLKRDIWCFISCDGAAVCPDMAWIRPPRLCCRIYANWHLDYIPCRPACSPSLSGITAGRFHPAVQKSNYNTICQRPSRLI